MSENEQTLNAKIDALERSLKFTQHTFEKKLVDIQSELLVLRESISEQQADSKLIAPVSENLNPVLNSDSGHSDDQLKAPRVDKAKAEWIEKLAHQIADNDSEQTQNQSASVENTQGSEPVFQTLSTDKTPVYEDIREMPVKSSLFRVFFAPIIRFLLELVLTRLAFFSAPFQELYHRFIKLYYHYQEQGKAPVFLMTVGGLITLTFGFAYLLQYSFTTLFNDSLKVITGFIIGTGIIYGGSVLSVKKTDFQDYAASVIALGIIFNYLTAYFIGPYYGIVSDNTGFLLLIGLTIASFALAIIFETRVVSAVTLVGGMLTPLIIGDVESAGLMFLVYFFILAAGNLYLSQRIQWPALANTAFILSFSVIEYVGISQTVHPLAAITLLSGFFYLYTYYWSFDRTQLKPEFSKQDLSFLVANIFYFIYAILQIHADNAIVAGVLITHAIVLIFIVKTLQLMKSIIAPMYLLFIGLLIATAAFVLTPADVMSIIWAIEGLAMVYIGFQYTQKLIRTEGYTIYTVAMFALLWQTFLAFNQISTQTVPWHWINLAAFGGLSFMAYRIINHFRQVADDFELNASFVQNEIFTFWGALVWSFILYKYLPTYSLVLAFIPMLWCFYRVSCHRLVFAQWVGYISFFAFIAQIIIDIFSVNSTVIIQQSSLSWIAQIEIIFFSWVLFFYNRHFELKGRGQSFATFIHHKIFYAPLAFVFLALTNIANEPDSMEFGDLWLDFIIIGGFLWIAFFLVKKTEVLEYKETRTHHQTLLSETFSLYATVLFLYSVAIVSLPWVFNAAILPLLYLLHRGLRYNLPATEKLAWAHFLLFGALTLISYQTHGHLHFSEQTWLTRIAWIEALISAWAMQLIYDRLNYKGGWYTLATRLRVGVYLLIPLLFLPHVWRKQTDFFAVALWVSFVISWLMYKKINITPLLKQLKWLFYIAALASIFTAFGTLNNTTISTSTWLSLLTGTLIVGVFHGIEKTLQLNSIKMSVYRSIHIISPYFNAFVIAALSYMLIHSAELSIALVGLYFLYLIQSKRVFVIMRDTIEFSYWICWGCFIIVPVSIFVIDHSSNGFVIASLSSIIGLWVLTHQNLSISRLLTQRYGLQIIQLGIFHIIVFITYSGLLNTLFTPWSMGTTLAMLMHAILILFLTLINRYQPLIRISVALYAMTAVKVLVHDMNDFSKIHKVIALMCIGSLLMVAAYLFQKLRNKVASEMQK